MKKLRTAALAALFAISLPLLPAQNFYDNVSENASEVSQSLLPMEVFVGDQAELRYSFRSAVDFFPNADLVMEEKIDISKFPFRNLYNSLTIKSAYFSRNDMEYVISLQIVPWRPGIIEFPPFDLFSVLSLSDKDKNKNISYSILFEPIEIKSIVEKTNLRDMQPPAPPFIIPGTTYVLFALLLAALIVFALLLRALIKFDDIRRWFKHMSIRRAYRKNSAIAIKKIKRLFRNKKISDIDFCAGLQNITRAYLDFRFDYPFKSASARAIREGFSKICLGDIPDSIAYSVEDLTSMFIRTDYIRYAHDSIDSQLYPPAEHQAKLANYERKSLSDIVLKAIALFESDGASEEGVDVL
ncbi:MAG: hypothetical protein VZQ47_09405 [Treponema sp.]|nr:hypothetical protein [Treponema sp.]MEE3435758.1 hypothetical protein [Treponema sp.]